MVCLIVDDDGGEIQYARTVRVKLIVMIIMMFLSRMVVVIVG